MYIPNFTLRSFKALPVKRTRSVLRAILEFLIVT